MPRNRFITTVEGIVQTPRKVSDPLATRFRGAEGRIIENDVHCRNVTVLSRVKTAVRADHIFLTSVSRSKLSRIPYIRRRCVIDREVVGHADIEFLSARGQIFSPVEVVIRYHIATGDARHDLSLDRAVASGRTEARGLNRSVLCDQCSTT